MNSNPLVSLSTSYGDIIIEVFSTLAPITANNFLRYVENGLFDHSSFFRIVTETNSNQVEDNNARIQVVQGGLAPENSKLLPPIAHESTQQTGIKHLDGTISMARFAPGSADGSFFFCINDQPELDFAGKRYEDGLGFAAFGRVVKGREVLQAIYQQGEANEYLQHPIVITRAEHFVEPRVT